jgi:hypothetical protein
MAQFAGTIVLSIGFGLLTLLGSLIIAIFVTPRFQCEEVTQVYRFFAHNPSF